MRQNDCGNVPASNFLGQKSGGRLPEKGARAKINLKLKVRRQIVSAPTQNAPTNTGLVFVGALYKILWAPSMKSCVRTPKILPVYFQNLVNRKLIYLVCTQVFVSTTNQYFGGGNHGSHEQGRAKDRPCRTCQPLMHAKHNLIGHESENFTCRDRVG